MTINDIKQGLYTNVWIYGAGKVGKKILQAFSFFDIEISGVVISKKDGMVIPGVPVYSLEEVATPDEKSIFIITASEKHHSTIVNLLEQKGYRNYCFWNEKMLCDLWKLSDYTFEEQRHGNKKCCLVLAGYKEFLWDRIFDRLIRFIPQDVDVCIISSGVYKEKLSHIAKDQQWSYLATKINSVTLAQNVALSVMSGYEWVYKMDEDMFVTENSFDIIFDAYKQAEQESGFIPGYAAPLIPVNAFGYRTILDITNNKDLFEQEFGRVIVGGNPESEIEKNPEAAAFMWSSCPRLDEMNRKLQKDKIKYDFCSVRFSIGFILFEYDFWAKNNGFTVSGSSDMGSDEEEICSNCINLSRPIVVSFNTVVGHFSFGRQTERMKHLLADKPDLFEICI